MHTRPQTARGRRDGSGPAQRAFPVIRYQLHIGLISFQLQLDRAAHPGASAPRGCVMLEIQRAAGASKPIGDRLSDQERTGQSSCRKPQRPAGPEVPLAAPVQRSLPVSWLRSHSWPAASPNRGHRPPAHCPPALPPRESRPAPRPRVHPWRPPSPPTRRPSTGSGAATGMSSSTGSSGTFRSRRIP